MKFTLFNSVRNSTGVNADKPWPEFVKAHLMDHQVINDKSIGQLYSGAVYDMDPPKRGDANVQRMSMMVVDYDNSQGIGIDAKAATLPTLPEDVEPELAGLTYAFHSTHSHTVEWPRWRLVIPFSREVDTREWRIIFAYMYDRILGADENIDISCKDLSRAYWLPACTQATERFSFSAYEDGDLLDVDEILDDMGASLSPEFVASMTDNVVHLPNTPIQTPETFTQNTNVPAGRNDFLKQIVAAMLERHEPLEEIVCQVYQADIDKHGAQPLFNDASEGMRGSPAINALSFVTNVIRSIDSMRTRAAIDPQLPQFRPVNAVPDANIALPGVAEIEPLEVVTAASLYGRKPKDVEWLIDGWMPRGQTTAFYGDGGIGKTLFVQQLMTCVSGGMPFMGKAALEGPVMGLFAEDDIDQLQRRQIGINSLYGRDLRAQENMYFMSRVAQDNVLMQFDNKSLKGVLTAVWHQLRAEIEKHRPIMLVVDTAADTFGGIEIDRQHVRRYIQGALTSLAQEFNLALLLLAHPSAAGLSSKTGSGGSTAWHNSVRCRTYMYKDEEKGCTTIELMKNNYGQVGDKIDVVHNGLGFIAYGPEQVNGFADELKADLNIKWVKKMLDYCWDKKINISFAARANYIPKQLAKLAKIERYDIHPDLIERIIFDLDKKGQLEVMERGHNKSSGGTVRYIGG